MFTCRQKADGGRSVLVAVRRLDQIRMSHMNRRRSGRESTRKHRTACRERKMTTNRARAAPNSTTVLAAVSTRPSDGSISNASPWRDDDLQRRRRYVCNPAQRRPPVLTTMTIMTLAHIEIAAVVAWAIMCTILAVSLAGSAGNWPVFVGSGVLPLLILLQMWRPRLQPAYARMTRK